VKGVLTLCLLLVGVTEVLHILVEYHILRHARLFRRACRFYAGAPVDLVNLTCSTREWGKTQHHLLMW
jgi:hypothetical protein